MKRLLPFALIAIVLGAGLLTARYLQNSSTETPKPSPSTPATTASPTASVVSNAEPGAEPAHSHGDANALVTLEEFGDFECPPCGMLHPILKGLEAEFGPSKIRLVFREFP